jgi:hypothetical protein
MGNTEGLNVAWELFFSTIRVLIPLTMGKSGIVATIEMIGTVIFRWSREGRSSLPNHTRFRTDSCEWSLGCAWY